MRPARRAAPLDMLVAGLRGRPMADTDWDAVVALANHTLLTPALHAALEAAERLDELPADVAGFLAFIGERNRERNVRLREQLAEAVAALNLVRIVPILLKGSVPLFGLAGDPLPTRMTSDLDIGVPQACLARSRAALIRLGYAAEPGAREMARVRDGGVVDLRESAIAGVETTRGDLRVRIPTAEDRALHWIGHDLLKEGDYWRGRIDLRHLHDLARLAEDEGVDWAAMRAGSAGTMRNAIDTQLLTLATLFGTAVPPEGTERALVRFQHGRRLLAARSGAIGPPLRLAGLLAWLVHRLRRSPGILDRGPAGLWKRAVRMLWTSRSKL